MPTRSFIACCKSVCRVYGFSAPAAAGSPKGASASAAALSTSASVICGREVRLLT
ncbi:Uncharacterised protein [Mycobacteroides abscessus subsp. abscessus]|nr:Uncharacterised protein [Mycobacteroides abscessus subsp. abscessus]